MTIDELEQEVTRLRGEIEVADKRNIALIEKEHELTRRNVSLFERLRYIEHQLKQMRDQVSGILENGVDHS